MIKIDNDYFRIRHIVRIHKSISGRGNYGIGFRFVRGDSEYKFYKSKLKRDLVFLWYRFIM